VRESAVADIWMLCGEHSYVSRYISCSRLLCNIVTCQTFIAM